MVFIESTLIHIQIKSTALKLADQQKEAEASSFSSKDLRDILQHRAASAALR